MVHLCSRITTQFLRKLRKNVTLCDFEDRDKEIMRMLLAKTVDDRWREKAIEENWTETDLEPAELYARQLEQIALLKKTMKKCNSELHNQNEKSKQLKKNHKEKHREKKRKHKQETSNRNQKKDSQTDRTKN